MPEIEAVLEETLSRLSIVGLMHHRMWQFVMREELPRIHWPKDPCVWVWKRGRKVYIDRIG